MHSRDVETAQFARCAAVAQGWDASAQNQREANVFRLAAMVLCSRFPIEAERLMAASGRYFLTHPAERLAAAEVVRLRWIISLPRLRDRLILRLQARSR
ncbi:hypothetical protein [Cupriavidus taiwanensis]|uniref:hypothetical protein n=1 Tax=Cupriavidus taiwanensis TaxID=164546 RepID=UPI000E1A8AFB|nr:hypothetical protein [Cupriavidus taiwanensis]SOY70905.1 conserved hypothetical protein [Cupriavidus taiwanensis]